MEFETYADVIDAYNADDMGYSSLTDYIRDQNIQIKEIDMDPMGDFEKILGRKNGGMMIAIEQLGKGGITGGKTYHQYHDQFVPPDSESEMYANGGGVGSMMQPKKKNFKMQGGVRNYLGNQKQVKAPLKWQSSPNHPTTELAYITKAEKDLLVKSDLHGSLKGRVNKGPSGIMSLNGYGSKDPSQNVSGAAASAAETGSKNARDRAEMRAEFGRGLTGPALAPGVTPKTAQDFRNAAIVAGAGQRVNPGFFDSRNTISPYELSMAKASNPQVFNQIRGTGGIMGFLKSGGIFGNLLRGLGQKFGLGKTYDQPTYDMSEFSDYGIGGTPPGTLDLDPDAKIQDTSFITKNKKPPANIKTTNLNDFVMGDPSKYVTSDMINEFGFNKPEELTMMEQYYKDLDNKVTKPNIVPNASDLAIQTKTFNTIDALNKLGNTTEKGFFGTSLTDEGQALEDFRRSAIKFKDAPANTANTAQSALDFITSPNRAGIQSFEDMRKNKDFIQNAINQGFLQTEEDYKNQKSLKDFI